MSKTLTVSASDIALASPIDTYVYAYIYSLSPDEFILINFMC